MSSSMDVELRHMRALAAIGDEGTITDAAIASGVSQPALSRTPAQLESRLGTRLVESTTRRVDLTEAGHHLWEKAHRLLRPLDAALDAASTARVRPLRLGSAWAALGEQTLPVLRSWRDRHPEIDVDVHRVADPEAALRRGALDLAIVRTDPRPGSDLTREHLFDEPRVAAVAATSDLAGRASMTLAELADHPVVLCSSAASTTATLWPSGGQPRSVEVANTDAWLTAIALDDAVGVTAAGTAHDHPHPAVRDLPITDASAVTVRLLGPATPSHPASTALAAHAQRCMALRAAPADDGTSPLMAAEPTSDPDVLRWPAHATTPYPDRSQPSRSLRSTGVEPRRPAVDRRPAARGGLRSRRRAGRRRRRAGPGGRSPGRGWILAGSGP